MADGSKMDSISSLPDAILQHILCFVPTRVAIKTSVLSKRWRHVWCDTPSLSFVDDRFTLIDVASINQTLARYRPSNMLNFHLKTTLIKCNNNPPIDEWIKFAMSHNVENLSLDIPFQYPVYKYEFPDFFYVNSYVKKLTVSFCFCKKMALKCFVSWPSLLKLYLARCTLSDESFANILSGCPLLESLILYLCKLTSLDLTKSPRLRTLVVYRNVCVSRPIQIVAPHIHSLRLRNPHLPCTNLVDVSSLTKASLDISVSRFEQREAESLQDTVLKMIEKLQNVEMLTLCGNFLEILSLAEVFGIPFPILKVKALTFETGISMYVIPGIERLLQNSPDIQKLTLRVRGCCQDIPVDHLDKYLKSQGLNPDQCWRSKDGVIWNKSSWYVEPMDVISLVELMLKNTRKLVKIVVQFTDRCLDVCFEELIFPALSHYGNVTFMLPDEKSTTSCDES